MKKPITNMAASVHARLLKRAKVEGRPFNELLLPASVTGQEIRLAANYEGVRVRCGGTPGSARVALQIDGQWKPGGPWDAGSSGRMARRQAYRS